MQILPGVARWPKTLLSASFYARIYLSDPLRALLDADKVFLRSPFTQQMPGVVMPHNSSFLLAFSNKVPQAWHF